MAADETPLDIKGQTANNVYSTAANKCESQNPDTISNILYADFSVKYVMMSLILIFVLLFSLP